MTTQTEALRFWTELSSFNYVPLYFADQYGTLSDLYSDLYDLDSFTADMETYIQDKLGYITTLDDIEANFETALNTQLGFWQGTYFLFDSTNQIDQFHALTIAATSVSWDGQALTGYTFDAATLTFSGSVQFPNDTDPTTLSLNLGFSIPAQPPLDNSSGTTPDPVVWLEQRISFQRFCTGTVTINGTASQVHGKDGCYTPQGASDDSSSDPIDYWNGIYNAAIATGTSTDTTTAYPPEGLIVEYANSILTLNLLGGLTISDYQHFNNSLSWTMTNSTGQLVFYRTLNGLRAIAGSISSQGQTTYIQAFYRQELTTPAAMTAARTVAAEPPQVPHPLTTVLIATKTIPAGVSDRVYPLQTLAATGGTEPYTWSSTNLPPGLTLGSTSGNLYGIPTDAPGQYDFYVTATDDKGQTGTGTLTLTLVAPLTIKTTALPDSSGNTAYSATLSATGGDSSNYQWQVTSGSIGFNLTLDANTGKITGTPNVTAGGDTVTSFSVKVTSTVAGVTLENESTFTIKLVAIFSPTVITAILAGVVGLLFGTGVLFNLKDRYAKWKEAKAKADADPTVTPEAQAMIDALQTIVSKIQSTADGKSVTAKNNATDLAQGSLTDKLKQDFSRTLVSTLKALNQQKIQFLENARTILNEDIIALEKQITAKESDIQKTTDEITKERLSAERDKLIEQFKAKGSQMDKIERSSFDAQKENDGLDRNATDTIKIEPF